MVACFDLPDIDDLTASWLFLRAARNFESEGVRILASILDFSLAVSSLSCASGDSREEGFPSSFRSGVWIPTKKCFKEVPFTASTFLTSDRI